MSDSPQLPPLPTGARVVNPYNLATDWEIVGPSDWSPDSYVVRWPDGTESIGGYRPGTALAHAVELDALRGRRPMAPDTGTVHGPEPAPECGCPACTGDDEPAGPVPESVVSALMGRRVRLDAPDAQEPGDRYGRVGAIGRRTGLALIALDDGGTTSHPVRDLVIAAEQQPDPVRRNQSKHVGPDGQLRYDADGSAVYPAPTGMRRASDPPLVVRLPNGTRWQYHGRTPGGMARLRHPDGGVSLTFPLDELTPDLA